MLYKKYLFKAKCKNCYLEEEFEYIGKKDSEFKCLRCAKKLDNEILY